jgi:Cu/Ag efflux pump CusA
MVSYFLSLLSEGYSIDDAVKEGAKRRLRPVLMTAFIAALGLLPLLFASGVGSEIQKPLATVVLGGLVTSTALTLLILPPAFRMLYTIDHILSSSKIIRDLVHQKKIKIVGTFYDLHTGKVELLQS